MRRHLRQMGMAFGGAVVGAGMLVAVVWAILGALFTPSLRYDALRYAPERSIVCPGDPLAYTNTLTIDRPGLIIFTASWHQAASQIPVGPEDTLHPRVFTEPTVIGPKRRTNTVPALPPGHYELHFGAGEIGGRVAVHAVPFTVADCAERPH